MERLNEIVNNSYCDGDLHTHVLLSGGKINIGSRKALDFWNSYMECVSNKNTQLHLAEKPGSELPILVDVDLKTRIGKDHKIRKLYSLNHIKTIIKTYQAALNDVILDGIVSRKSTLTCVLLEKKPRFEEKNEIRYIKHGFHLHFPKCFVDVNVQKAYLIPIVKKNVEGMFDSLYTVDDGHCDVDEGGCKKLTDSFTTTHYDFIDDASLSAHWLMYGSRKVNGEPYVATKCFDGHCNEIDFEEAFHDYVLPKLFGEESQAICKGNVMNLLPRILSTRLHGRNCYYFKSKSYVNTPAVEAFACVKEKRTVFCQKTITETLSEATRLIELISKSRASDRSDWLSIGFCLHNITEGDDDGLTLWLEFSSYCEDKFSEAECICKWMNEMKDNNYTIGTLKYFAKLDSPERYEEFSKENCKLLIEKAVDGGHNDMAKILYNAYQNEFVYSTRNDQWYQFHNHIWQEVKNFALSERISNNHGAIISQFYSYIHEAHSELRKMGASIKGPPKKRKTTIPECDNDDDDEDDIRASYLRNRIEMLEKLIKQCKNNSFKNAVMKECQEVFRDDMFNSRLNKDPYLVAFKNGVYDFKNDCFRDGKPEDYLSVSLSIEYFDYKSLEHAKVMEVDDFFSKVLPDIEVKKYFLEQTSQLFIGGNHDKIFLIWTGSGNNGKSVTQKFFERMLGKLAVKISTTLLTGKKSSMGQATPELARTGNGVRWLVMDEPDKGEKITTGVLKAITGNDSFYARGLYKDGEEISPMFKLVMLCNDLPAIQNPDDASWDRVRVIPFESKFVHESLCPRTLVEQMSSKTFPEDPHFAKKIDDLLQPFAWYLIYYWRGLNRKNRIIPDKVRIATNTYKEENNDPTQEFVEDELDENPDSEIFVDELCVRYREWWRVNYPTEKLNVTKNVIINAFTKILGDHQTIITGGRVKKKIIKGYGWRKCENINPML